MKQDKHFSKQANVRSVIVSHTLSKHTHNPQTVWSVLGMQFALEETKLDQLLDSGVKTRSHSNSSLASTQLPALVR